MKTIPRYNLSMARTAREILEEASQLPPAQIDWLIESLLIKEGDAPQAEVDAAWDTEIKRRLDEIDSGVVKMRPLDDVLARMEAHAAAKQQK